MEMEQNSESWLKWRHNGLGGSDAPIIMGTSPFLTRFELWKQKIGPAKTENETNFIFEKGHRLEKVARARFEIEIGAEFPPALVEMESHSFIRSSLDGYNKERNETWECKYVGKDDFEKVKNGQMLEKYFPQVQQQLMVTGADRCHFYCINDDKETVSLIVDIDKKYIIEELLPALCEFWEMDETKTPPELSDADAMKIKDPEFKKILRQFKNENEKAKTWKKKADATRKLVAEKMAEMNHPLAEFGKFRVVLVERKGSIDYSKIPELENVDLEQYRKEGSSSYKVTY